MPGFFIGAIMNIDKEEIVRKMTGSWPMAISAISGLNQKYYSGKHMDCPACGGRDRFRYDDKLPHSSVKDGSGSYICSQCGNGDGLSLLMKSSGMSFREALESLHSWLGGSNTDEVRRAQQKYKAAASKKGYGAYVESDRCLSIMESFSRVESCGLSIENGVWYDGMMTATAKSGAEVVCMPVVFCDNQDEVCDIAFIAQTDAYRQTAFKFLSGGFPAAGVSVIPGSGEYTYLCVTWQDAAHTATATKAKVLVCWTPENMDQVAHQMNGENIRVSCHKDDIDSLHVADERGVQVVLIGTLTGGGIERKIHDATALIAKQ